MNGNPKLAASLTPLLRAWDSTPLYPSPGRAMLILDELEAFVAKTPNDWMRPNSWGLSIISELRPLLGLAAVAAPIWEPMATIARNWLRIQDLRLQEPARPVSSPTPERAALIVKLLMDAVDDPAKPLVAELQLFVEQQAVDR